MSVSFLLGHGPKIQSYACNDQPPSGPRQTEQFWKNFTMNCFLEEQSCPCDKRKNRFFADFEKMPPQKDRFPAVSRLCRNDQSKERINLPGVTLFDLCRVSNRSGAKRVSHLVSFTLVPAQLPSQQKSERRLICLSTTAPTPLYQPKRDAKMVSFFTADGGLSLGRIPDSETWTASSFLSSVSWR